MIFAAFNSVLSLGYYAPLVNRMYRHQAGETGAIRQPGFGLDGGSPGSFGGSRDRGRFLARVVNGLTLPAAQSLLPLAVSA